MDLVGACRVFVHVGERGSFTLGAAAAGVPQSVASRRIAALERHFGGRLFDRSTRRAALTAFGRDMLPSAKRLVRLAEAMECDAEQIKLRPLSLAMPATCALRHLVALDAAARDGGTVLDIRRADPAERAELLRTHEVRAALLAVPPTDADWVVPLGVAFAPVGARGSARAASAGYVPDDEADQGGFPAADTGPLHLETLRPGRTERRYRRLWIQPEDDVPHVRDRLEQLGHRAALVPAQITVATSLVAAASEATRAGGFLLCPPEQARELGLGWRRLAGSPVARGYGVAAVTGDDAERVRGEGLRAYVAGALGAGAADAAVDRTARTARAARETHATRTARQERG